MCKGYNTRSTRPIFGYDNYSDEEQARYEESYFEDGDNFYINNGADDEDVDLFDYDEPDFDGTYQDYEDFHSQYDDDPSPYAGDYSEE